LFPEFQKLLHQLIIFECLILKTGSFPFGSINPMYLPLLPDLGDTAVFPPPKTWPLFATADWLAKSV
jgi:hypothetical protein